MRVPTSVGNSRCMALATRRIAWQLCALSLLPGLICIPTLNAQSDANLNAPIALKPTAGITANSTISGQTNARFELTLQAGTYAAFALDSDAAEVAVTCANEAGVQLFNTVSWSPDDKHPRFAVPTANTSLIACTVALKRTLEHSVPIVISVVEVRSATADDFARLAADTEWTNAWRSGSSRDANDRRAAIAGYKHALQTYERFHDRARVGMGFNRLGQLYNLLGEKRIAIESYQRALTERDAVGDRQGVAITLLSMGWAYAFAGEIQKALDYTTQSLAIRREIGDKRGEAAVLLQLGYIHLYVGMPQRALADFQQALPVFREAGETFPVVRILGHMGEAYYTLDRDADALAVLQEALALQNEKFKAILIVNTRVRISQVYSRMGQRDRATEQLGLALEMARQSQDPAELGKVFLALGENYLLGNELDAARSSFQQALVTTKAGGDSLAEAACHYGLARVARLSGELAVALNEIEQAVGAVETLRAQLQRQEHRASFLGSAGAYYEFYTDLLWQLHGSAPLEGYDQRAFVISERVRARSMVEGLAEVRAGIRRGISPELQERERNLHQRINSYLYTRHVEEVEKRGEEATSDAELEGLLAEYDALQVTIRRTNPRYAELVHPVAPASRSIQSALDPDTALLEFQLGSKRSFLWLVTAESVRMFELPARDLIEADARRLYRLLSRSNAQTQAGPDAATATSLPPVDVELATVQRRLARMLLGSAWPLLKQKRIVVVADGALQYVPFAALAGPASIAPDQVASSVSGITGIGSKAEVEPAPLIVDHEISYLPSAAVILSLRAGLQQRASPGKTLAIFADPVFSTDDMRVRKALAPHARLPIVGGYVNRRTVQVNAETFQRKAGAPEQARITRLPFSRREAAAIMSVVPKRSSFVALDFMANRPTVTDANLTEFKFIHFATHGWLDSERPEFSGIVLSMVKPDGTPQDGFLRLHEIYDLHLAADLVVLSSCQTGLGAEVKGEGVIGLARGFLYAGANRVVASLWKVDDAATADLMARFYRNMLTKKMSPTAALRASQVEMWKEGRWRNPYYWAAFELQGEWR